jgi:class 3 adenylate cyclase/tetratricopeptide (TPR) repeat protein
MRCSKCGSDSPRGKKFCGDCGAPLTSRCPKCGANNSLSNRFCGDCGTALAVKGANSQLPAHFPSTPDIVLTAEQMASAIDGERKIITALFADIKGSTELMRDLDPEEARAIIDPVLQLMMDAVHRYDGYVAQSTGDGIFAMFGAPVAHEDHPQRALRAALTIQQQLQQQAERLKNQGRPPVEARIGVNTGEVVLRMIHTGGHTEYSPVGHAANLAARMQTIARAGGITITEECRRLVEGYFSLRELGPTEIKGISQLVNVYEVIGPGPLRGHFELATRRGLARFVGRERELAELQRALELALAAHGQIVAVVADAGTGKSRLFHEFKATLPSSCKVLEAYSVSHGKASAWLPVLELLRDYFGFLDNDDPETRREKVRTALEALDPALASTLPYLFGPLGVQEAPDSLGQMDHEVKQGRTLDAIKRIVVSESLRQPTIVIFEDLHWVDSRTQEVLDLLVDSITSARALLLVNYRPEYSHRWNNKTYYAQLRLDPLGKESAGEMLLALLGDGKDLIPLKRLIIDKTEGNPFFMEETVQVLFDEGALVRDGAAVRLTKPLNALKIPPTVQGILAARIDCLPADAKELLQTLAVIGREFPISVIRAVAMKSDDELNLLLNDLQLGEFIYEQPTVGDTEYVFKHALTQEVAYNSVLTERRQQLHECTGAAIETLYASTVEEHLAELAHHYGRSANPGKAVEYLTRAGQQALNRTAFAEAQAQLQQGLEWIKKLSETPERDARELKLASTLAQVLLVTRGYTAPETRAVAERARDLAEKGGNLGQLVAQVFVIWRSVLTTGDYSTASLLADRLLDIAQREGSPASFGFVCRAHTNTNLYRGDLVVVEEQFARWSSFLNADGFRQVSGAAVSVIGIAGLCAGALGRADSARERIVRTLAFGLDSNNPYDLAVARALESWLFCWLREPHHTEVAATQALAIAEEHGFPFIKGMTRPRLGWARAQLDRAGEGVALIRQGLADLAEAGVRLNITDFFTCLGEAQALDGKFADALITIEEALQANPEELINRPNALTCRGELRLN